MALHPPSSTYMPLVAIFATAAVFLATLGPCSAAGIDFRIGLRPVDTDRNLTPMEVIHRKLNRDRERLSRLEMRRGAGGTFGTVSPLATSMIADFRSQIQPGDGDYAMNISLGTPPVAVTGIMDTGSDLLWTPCPSGGAPTAGYNPAKSPTTANVSCASDLCNALQRRTCGVGCEYTYSYGDGSSTRGYLASDTVTFGPGASAPNISFGCGVVNGGKGLDGGRGLIGLGRGKLSLVSQLGVGKFAYCLSQLGGAGPAGSLAVGPHAGAAAGPGASTPLIANPQNPSFYYVSLEGISVGPQRLPIPPSVFEAGRDGSGGVIVDSGTTVTMIPEDAYNLVRAAFVAQTTGLKVAPGRAQFDASDERMPVGQGQMATKPLGKTDTSGLDLCFELGGKTPEVAAAAVPKLTFHFKGMDLALPVENYMVGDTAGGKICLALSASGVMTLFGNVQQQNMVMVHDLEKQTLSMIHGSCDNL